MSLSNIFAGNGPFWQLGQYKKNLQFSIKKVFYFFEGVFFIFSMTKRRRNKIDFLYIVALINIKMKKNLNLVHLVFRNTKGRHFVVTPLFILLVCSSAISGIMIPFCAWIEDFATVCPLICVETQISQAKVLLTPSNLAFCRSVLTSSFSTSWISSLV